MPCSRAFWNSAKNQLSLDRIESFFSQFLSISNNEIISAVFDDDELDEEARTYPNIALFDVKALYGIVVVEKNGLFDMSQIQRKHELLKLMSTVSIQKQAILYASDGKSYASWKLKQYDKNAISPYQETIDYILGKYNAVQKELLAIPTTGKQGKHVFSSLESYIKLTGNTKLLIEIIEFLEDLINQQVDDKVEKLADILGMVEEFETLTDADIKHDILKQFQLEPFIGTVRPVY